MASLKKGLPYLLLPYGVYGAIIGGAEFWAATHAPFWQVALWTGIGWVIWTLLEYLLHRFGFHEKPGKPLAQKYDIHWIHHREPHDPSHIVTSLRLTLPVAALLGGIFWVVGQGSPLVGAAYGGLGIGYLLYETLHLYMHMQPVPPFRFLRKLWQHHYWHHFRTPDKYYGVTVRWWDWVFGTA